MAASNNRVRHYLLLTFLVVVGIFFVRQYLPMIEIPTNGHIKEEEARLQSRMNDLAVQIKMNEDWGKELMQLRGKASVFWVCMQPGVPVEQEVLEEFNNISRLASVNIQQREPKLLRNQKANYIQEVELRIELRGVSMREFSRLLKEISRNRRKFYWVTCMISPDNLNKPTGIRVTGKLVAYVLTEEGTRLLDSAPVETANEKASEPQEAAPPRATRGSKTSQAHSGGARTGLKQNGGK